MAVWTVARRCYDQLDLPAGLVFSRIPMVTMCPSQLAPEARWRGQRPGRWLSGRAPDSGRLALQVQLCARDRRLWVGSLRHLAVKSLCGGRNRPVPTSGRCCTTRPAERVRHVAYVGLRPDGQVSLPFQTKI